MQTWRRSELVLGVTSIRSHNHVGSQALGEVCLVDVFLLWQLFPDGQKADFQLISHLMFLLEFMVLFQHGASDVIVP